MADLFVQQGHPEQALPIYEKLAAADPTNGALARKLADARAMIGGVRAPVPAAPSFASNGASDDPEEILRDALAKIRERRRAPSSLPALSGRET
jgi:hypothetical protein